MLSVLVIDDQKPVLEVIRLFLERFGNMNVKTALSAKEALEFLMGSSVDAMVVDYDLPDINGIDFLKLIRAKGDTTPVIIFTGVGREYAAIQALNNGADFFLKKEDDAQSQLLELVNMIRQAVDRKSLGRGLGATQKILSDVLNFFHQAAYVIDREGKVMVWNKGMEKMTGVAEKDILGKGDWDYSIPFFGHRAPMLSDLIFQDESTIMKNNYSIIEREKGTLTAWVTAIPEEGHQAVYWMKSMALYDSKGMFIGVLGKVRDITEQMGSDMISSPAQVITRAAEADPVVNVPQKGMFDKLLGRAKGPYREGLRLSYREGKYSAAIPFFDQALEIDPSLAFAWHDRGVCYRELGNNSEALKNFDKALELAPGDEEILFSRGELLRKMGILLGQRDLLESAVQNLNRVVELNPNQADAWNSLGLLSRELGRESLSRQYYEKGREVMKRGAHRKKTRNLDQQV